LDGGHGDILHQDGRQRSSVSAQLLADLTCPIWDFPVCLFYCCP